MAKSTILLLESDDLTFAHFADLLAHHDIEVLQARTFAEAFEKLKAHAGILRLFLLDFELATNEADFLERQRKLEFGRPIPIALMGEVALSAAEIKQLKEDSSYAGYICKHATPADMIAQIVSLATEDAHARKFPRVFFSTKVHCVFQQRNYIGEMVMLSLNGTFIHLKEEAFPEKGHQGEVTFNGAVKGKKPIHLTAEVVTVRRNQADVVSIYPSGIGVKFTRLTPESTQMLQDLIDHQIGVGKLISERV